MRVGEDVVYCSSTTTTYGGGGIVATLSQFELLNSLSQTILDLR